MKTEEFRRSENVETRRPNVYEGFWDFLTNYTGQAAGAAPAPTEHYPLLNPHMRQRLMELNPMSNQLGAQEMWALPTLYGGLYPHENQFMLSGNYLDPYDTRFEQQTQGDLRFSK